MNTQNTVHLSIGNSDGKLAQPEWADYYAETDAMVRAYAVKVFGAWVSLPTSPYQNACWAFEMHPAEDWLLFQRRIARLAKKWGQDSIALNRSETQFVTPALLDLSREEAEAR